MLPSDDGEAIPDGSVLRADVAIVGAGAAGLTIARELAGGRLNILVVESGGQEPEDRFQALSRGESVGAPYWPLDGNRQRCVGGTTNHWTGWCRPFDDLDLSPRDWIPGSGWPIARDSLSSHYERAHEICQLGPFDYDVATWERRLEARRLPLDGASVITKMFQLSPPTHFGSAYAPVLRTSDNVRLLHHATVLEIESPPESRIVAGLSVGTLGGRRFRIEARAVVLAAGGVENARLLLLSNRHRPAGLGNDNDQVGRCFMEHLHFTFGEGVLRGVDQDLERLYSPRGPRAAVARIFTTPQLQREHGLLQSNVMLIPAAGDTRPGWRRAGRRTLDRLLRGVTVRFAHTIEQPPVTSNRVVLGDDHDAFGQRRIRLEWRIGEMEKRTFQWTRRAVEDAIDSAGLGRTRASERDAERAWPPEELQGMRGHHMGTTRMSIDPKDGVVDTNCRVHGIDNLFVAGSSVFPTAGAGTPTLTIVSLATRLADHLLSDRNL